MSIGFGIERLGHFTLKFPRIIAVAVIAFTSLCLWQLLGATVDGNLLRVYRDSGVYYDRYVRLSETFGTFENDAYILVESPNLTDPAVIEGLRNLAFDLELSSYAVGTLSPFSLRKPAENDQTAPAVPEDMQSREEAAAALQDLRATDPIMRNLITEDLTGMVMIMFPDIEKTAGGGESAMLAELRSLIADYSSEDISIELTGPPVWKTEMLDASIHDQLTFSLYGFLIGAVMSFISLRSFWGAFLATLTPALAVIWSGGLVVMLFGSFTFLTNIVITLVLVIAFAESMYFCFTWLRLWRDGTEPVQAISDTIERVTPAAALTSLTTMVAFGTLALTQGQGIEEFGISGVFSVGITFLVLVTFLPLVLRLAVKLGFKPPKDVSIAVYAPIPIARHLSSRYSRTIAVVSIIVIALLFYPHFNMQPRFNFEDFLPSNSQALETASEIDKGVGGVAPIYIRVPLEQGVENVGDADYAKIDEAHKILETIIGAGKVISAASFAHYADSGFSREQIFNAVGPFLKRRFITDDGSQALVTGFLPTVLKSAEIQKIVTEAERELARADVAGAEIGGFSVLTAFASTNIIASLRDGLTLAIVINICIIGLAFRSLKVALISIVPNFLPILGTELYLWASGAGLQLTTVIALTVAFGIAVNDTIHFLASYLRLREQGRDHRDAVLQTLERVGPALVATTLILCAGTSVVLFSALPQVALFGTLMVLTLILAIVGDLLILPAMLLAGGRFFSSFGVVRK